MSLNPRQQRFVALYLGGASAAEAYRGAGYTCKNAHTAAASAAKLLTKADIAAAVAAAAERAELTREWVVRSLMREATAQGKGASHAARVRALELLGRRFGLFAEQLEVSGPAGGPIPVDLRTLSDGQLAQLDAILAAAAEVGPADTDPGARPGGEGPA